MQNQGHQGWFVIGAMCVTTVAEIVFEAGVNSHFSGEVLCQARLSTDDISSLTYRDNLYTKHK